MMDEVKETEKYHFETEMHGNPITEGSCHYIDALIQSTITW